MDPDNSPSLRNKRLRDETSDDKSGSNVQGRREVLQARLTNAVHDRAVDSGRQSPRTMSPSAAFVLLSAAAAGGPTVMTSLAETPAAHGGPGMTLARATELEELVLQSRALCGASGAGCASEPKEVVVHYGPTGTGKTRYCYEQFPDAYMFANAQEARRDTVVSRFILGYRAGPPTLIPDSDNERRFFIRDEAGAVRALDLGAGAGPSGAAGGVAGAGGLNLGGAVAEEE